MPRSSKIGGSSTGCANAWSASNAVSNCRSGSISRFHAVPLWRYMLRTDRRSCAVLRPLAGMFDTEHAARCGARAGNSPPCCPAAACQSGLVAGGAAAGGGLLGPRGVESASTAAPQGRGAQERGRHAPCGLGSSRPQAVIPPPAGWGLDIVLPRTSPPVELSTESGGSTARARAHTEKPKPTLNKPEQPGFCCTLPGFCCTRRAFAARYRAFAARPEKTLIG
jgi:hypothetical protein